MALNNKTAIISGGASGIGKAIVTKFISEGAFVHILDIDKKSGVDLVHAIQKKEEKVEFHYCDISRQQDVGRIMQQISKKYRIDIMVNNAGVSHIGNIENTFDHDLDRLININIKGLINCTRACIPEMKKAGAGVILNIASVAASVGLNDRFGYSMTKGAVVAMTYSIAKDYLAHNIRCNSISPARIHTPFVDGFLKRNYPGKEDEMFQKLAKTQPIGRMGEPEEVAELACFLCSEKASFITGTDYPIDGGFLKLNT